MVSCIPHHAFLLYILRILWVNPPYPQRRLYMLIQQTSPAIFWKPKATWQQTSWNGGDHPETCWLIRIPKSKQYDPPYVLKMPLASPPCKGTGICSFEKYWIHQKGLHLCQSFLCANNQEIIKIIWNHASTNIYQDLVLLGYIYIYIYMWAVFAASPRRCCDKTLPRLLPSSESSASIAPNWG